MHILVYGENAYRMQEKVAAMRARFKETRDASGLNERVLRAAEHSVDDVQEAIFSSPFLAERKLVVLHGFLGAKKAEQERVVDMLGRAPDSTVTIFVEHASAKSLAKSPLFDALKDEDFSEEFIAFDGPAAEKFVVSECAANDMTIERAAVRTLIALVGLEPWTLHHEVGKLCAYAGASRTKTVTETMVHETVNGERDESVFPFLDACMQGRGDVAAKLLEDLVRGGTSELMILSMLAKQMRTMIGAKDLERRGFHDKNEIAKKLGVHPFPAGKAMTAVRDLPYEHLVELHERLVEMERNFKTGGPDLLAQLNVFGVAAFRR